MDSKKSNSPAIPAIPETERFDWDADVANSLATLIEAPPARADPQVKWPGGLENSKHAVPSQQGPRVSEGALIIRDTYRHRNEKGEVSGAVVKVHGATPGPRVRAAREPPSSKTAARLAAIRIAATGRPVPAAFAPAAPAPVANAMRPLTGEEKKALWGKYFPDQDAYRNDRFFCVPFTTADGRSFLGAKRLEMYNRAGFAGVLLYTVRLTDDKYDAEAVVRIPRDADLTSFQVEFGVVNAYMVARSLRDKLDNGCHMTPLEFLEEMQDRLRAHMTMVHKLTQL